MKAELERRQSNTDKVLEVFRSRPLQWIEWAVFADLVGERAYRTRVSNAKKIITAIPNGATHAEGVIESRTYTCGPRIITEYRFLPYVPIPSRDVGKPMQQKGLF